MYSILEVMLYISLVGMWYIYGGLLLILKAVSLFHKKEYNVNSHISGYYPAITVYLSAYNEEETICARLINICEQKYPPEKIEIYVISDGSTDQTAEYATNVAKKYPKHRIHIIEFDENKGQYIAQNHVAENSTNEILISTDADTSFNENFLYKIVQPFSDPVVAVVGGEKRYKQLGTDISKSIGIYQQLEYGLRKVEDALGVMCKTDGPCTAYRKAIWESIEEFEDVDQIICILAAKKGYVSRHVSDAICYEKTSDTPRQELKARSRMTRKAIMSTLHRLAIIDLFTMPVFVLVLVSHKLVRFLSPFLLILFIFSLVLLAKYSSIYLYILYGLIGCVMSLIVIGKHGFIISFIIANYGFFLGVVEYVQGKRSGKYMPTRKI